MTKQKNISLVGKVRTRIAPSPTGFPHVGTAFQALFDWVFAQRYEGKFILRIEDTDQKRFVAEAEEVLHQAFSWLNIIPDEGPDIAGEYGPYRQSERLSLYQKYAQELVKMDKAYYCFCSPERLQEVRDQQRQAGIPPKYDRHCRSLSKQEVEQRLANGERAVIRLKVPDDVTIEVFDKLRGKVEFDSNTIDDQVLLKSDGYPTYHLAVVVDDHLMEITHVVRGEEWLPSAPKHALLYQYFGWQMPELIHTPTLRNTDKSKLSKRKGNTSVWWYREHGYLSSTLLNFLALLAWKPSENQEIFSLDEMVNKFEWEQMNITGPIFDLKKLDWLNGKYMRELSLDDLYQQIIKWSDWVVINGEDEDVIKKAHQLQSWHLKNQSLFKSSLKLAQDRARTLLEFHDLMELFFEDELNYDLEDLLQKQSADVILAVLSDVVSIFENSGEIDSSSWEKSVRELADKHQLPHKIVFMTMRSALTARKFTPPLYEIMIALGWQDSLERIKRATEYINHNKLDESN